MKVSTSRSETAPRGKITARRSPKAELRETQVVADAIRKTMSANRSKDTGPELKLRQALSRLGIRGYRLHRKNLPGTPDIDFPRLKLALFVHGSFWHGCPHCGNYRVPKTNTAFWIAKLEETRNRDERALGKLAELGYEIITVWECEIDHDAALVAARVLGRLKVRESREERNHD